MKGTPRTYGVRNKAGATASFSGERLVLRTCRCFRGSFKHNTERPHQTRRRVNASRLWYSGAMPGPLLSLIGLLLLCGCAAERCDKEIDQEAAVRIAREYFLSRSIAQLQGGRPFEQAEAKRMRSAGMTEETYRETFQLAEPGRARRVGDQLCGHPLIYYQASRSLAYDGFNVYFNRVVPGNDMRGWRKTVTGVNITKCGMFGGFLRTYDSGAFREGHLEPKQLGFDTCP